MSFWQTPSTLPDGVVVAQEILVLLAGVQIPVRQLSEMCLHKKF